MINSRQSRNLAVRLRAGAAEQVDRRSPQVARINFDARSGRFDVTLEVPTGAVNRGNGANS